MPYLHIDSRDAAQSMGGQGSQVAVEDCLSLPLRLHRSAGSGPALASVTLHLQERDLSTFRFICANVP